MHAEEPKDYRITIPSDQDMFTLITSYYRAATPIRQAEIDEALRRNLENPCIQRIYLFNDAVYDAPTTFPFADKLCQVVVGNGTLSFSTAISWINAHVTRGNRCILSNSDIAFDMTLHHLYTAPFDHIVYALTRWEDGIIKEEFDSQDCWMFAAPLEVPLEACEFRLGILGCDNRFAHVLDTAGYALRNPCLTVSCHHLHASKERPQLATTERIPPPYAFVGHHRLGQVPKHIPPRLQ